MNVVRRPIRLARLYANAFRLRRRIRAHGSKLDPRAAYAFTRAESFAAVQSEREIVSLLELVAREPPRAVLEIGTFSGGTIYLFSRVAVDGARLVTVDLDGGPGAALGRLSPLGLVVRAVGAVPILRADSQRPSHAPRSSARSAGAASTSCSSTATTVAKE